MRVGEKHVQCVHLVQHDRGEFNERVDRDGGGGELGWGRVSYLFHAKDNSVG